VRKNLLILFLSFGACIIIAEGVLRTLGIPEREELLQIGWNSADIYPDMVPLNQLGFRGQAFNTTQNSKNKVILLGDSQIEANGLPYSFTLENLLQERTKEEVDIYSIGSGGYGQDQQLLALQLYFQSYTAHHVILWFTPENDVWNNLFPTHWPWNGNPKPSFYLSKDGGLHGPNFEHRYSFRFNTKIHLLRILGIMVKTFSLKSLDTKWAKQMPDANVLKPLKNVDPNALIIPVGQQEALLQEKSHYTIYQEKRSPRMDYGIQLTIQLLDSLQSICHRNGASFSIFYIDNQFVYEMPDKAIVSADNECGLAIDKTQYYNTVEEILAGFKHRHIPLVSPWRAISLQDRHHLNHQAQTELADSLNLWIFEILSNTNTIPATNALGQRASKDANDL
jgi:hypothetical protein